MPFPNHIDVPGAVVSGHGHGVCVCEGLQVGGEGRREVDGCEGEQARECVCGRICRVSCFLRRLRVLFACLERDGEREKSREVA